MMFDAVLGLGNGHSYEKKTGQNDRAYLSGAALLSVC